MSDIVARTGRHRQRYDNNNLRLVSGCIPYRLANNDCQCIQSENRVEVLMISSPNRSDMVFPKGGWENDETVEEAACREALEEAGVRGILKETPLGVWEFRSKSNIEMCKVDGGCKGYMFALEVTEELDYWPERNNRDRKWVVIEDAFELCRYEWMRLALAEFVRMILAEKGNTGRHELSMKELLVVIEPRPEQHPVSVVSDEDDSVVEDDEDCDILSAKCHPKTSNAPLATAFGIMLPAGIFL